MTSMLLIVTEAANNTLIDAFRVHADEVESLADVISSLLALRVLEARLVDRFFDELHSLSQFFLFLDLFLLCIILGSSLFLLIDLINFLNLWLHN